MTDSEELKHARARIEADDKTIAELRAMLAVANKPAPKKPIQRKPERYIVSREGAELLVNAIKIKGEFLDYRSRLQAMHRRAQRAESELVKLRRKHASKMILLKSTRPEDSDYGWIYTATPQPEIFEAHGLEWWRHEGGRECPCNPLATIEILFRYELEADFEALMIPARIVPWKNVVGASHLDIIGWRPANAPEKLPPPLPHIQLGQTPPRADNVRTNSNA